MEFQVIHRDKSSSARTGRMQTGHGMIDTPVFMPVGTVGAVKAIHIRDLLDDIPAQIFLCNTYHLFLRPGLEIIRGAGGIHGFNGWGRPILTDSGGYQVFSLSGRRKITAGGVVFHSHIDGSRHVFTPENTVDTQRILGSDIMMALDECTPFPCDYDYAKKSLDLTHRWLERAFDHFRATMPLYGHEQAIFPIVQGSVYKDLRRISAETVASYNAAGNAIGGLSVGEPAGMMYEMTAEVCSILPPEKPRYLMGVGTPSNLLECIALGIDMFDCVLPTRNGRNGMLFTPEGTMNMKNEKWKNDHSPIWDPPFSFVDSQYSRAFLRHLFVANEMLGPMIASHHNLGFYFWLMREARRNIAEGSFTPWKNALKAKLQQRI